MDSLSLMIKLQDNTVVPSLCIKCQKYEGGNKPEAIEAGKNELGNNLRRDDSATKRIKFLNELNTDGHTARAGNKWMLQTPLRSAGNKWVLQTPLRSAGNKWVLQTLTQEKCW